MSVEAEAIFAGLNIPNSQGYAILCVYDELTEDRWNEMDNACN